MADRLVTGSGPAASAENWAIAPNCWHWVGMTWANAEISSSMPARGEVRFIEPGRNVKGPTHESDSVLVVAVPAPSPAARGRLALVIESAVEEALDRRGAAPPGVGASSDLDASLSDQLYRARHVGAVGLELRFESLQGIANLAGALDAEDSAVLRWWLSAASERPVRLLLDASDRYLSIYDEPVSLRRLVGPPPDDLTPEPADARVVSPQPEVRASAQAMELSEQPPVVTRADRVEPTDEAHDAAALAKAMAALFDEHVDSDRVPPVVEIDLAPFVDSTAPTTAAPEPGASPSVQSMEPPLQPPETAAMEPAPESSALEAGPTEPQCEQWMSELEATRGPKPLAVIERLFVSSYVPLCDAIARGVTDGRAESVAQVWAKSFEKSYSEAFDALRVRGKRPTMVLDVPDIALRVARLHGARSVQLLLVDGMRFDLGLRVNELLKRQLGQRAALTERLLLWSALPTRTEVQLALLGKGPAGLKDSPRESDSEIPVARGRAASTPRRIRAGQREVLKLDLVEAAMSVPGGPLRERLDAVAGETAEALAEHFSKQAPRTLVMVFSDHGALIEPMGGGTTAGRHGGASPEEVLVPAFAWLVGNVH